MHSITTVICIHWRILIRKAQFNPRTPAILAVAKSYGLDLATKTIVSAEDASDEYLDLNPLGKIPTLVGANGFVVSECIAIALYGENSEYLARDFR